MSRTAPAPASTRVDTLALHSRRAFLGGATVVGAGLALAGSLAPAWSARAAERRAERQPAVRQPTDRQATDPFAMETKFAKVVPISTWDGGGAWAIISTWGETFTLCNGGIIAGKNAVIIVDGFHTMGGAQWAARMAKHLTGRDPSHVVVTHYHFDHVDGLGGYLALPEAPIVISTPTTRQLMAKRGVAGGGNLFGPAPASTIPGLSRSIARCVLPDTVIDDTSKPLPIDLGGRQLLLRERAGHTSSDLNVEIVSGGKDGQKIIYTGDMVFNNIFPVYLDALPKLLRKNVAEVISEDNGKSIIVPGHGQMTTGAQLAPFLAVIDFLNEAGAKARAAGTPAKDAAAALVLPESLKAYAPQNALFPQLAFEAIYREIDASK
jgi:glyoxylase-like metal-dependent hydrolase (beta-lactamase superfamily II)